MSEHEDLEDGEIEDDDEEVAIVPEPQEMEAPLLNPVVAPKQQEDVWDDESNAQEVTENKIQNVKNINDAKARLIDEVAPPKNSKRSKPAPVVGMFRDEIWKKRVLHKNMLCISICCSR